MEGYKCDTRTRNFGSDNQIKHRGTRRRKGRYSAVNASQLS